MQRFNDADEFVSQDSLESQVAAQRTICLACWRTYGIWLKSNAKPMERFGPPACIAGSPLRRSVGS